LRYGGNTSCVSVRSDSGTLIILDVGTGAAVLGRELLASGETLRGHILIGHTHWDHIQGLPFFPPLFIPGAEWDIYAPRGLQESVRETLAGQMQHTYFPVDLDQVGATVRYHDLVEGALKIGDINVTARYLNHPALTLGYRLEADGASVVYACDHEPHSRALAEPNEEIVGQDLRHAEFLSGAGLVIHDAQYVASEYSTKVGWGHSTVEYAIAVAHQAGAKRLALTHHDPGRTDAALDAILEKVAARTDLDGMEVFGACEGQEIELRNETQLTAPATPAPAADVAIGQALIGVTILMAMTTPGRIETLTGALDKEGVRWVVVDPKDAVEAIDQEHPSLMIIEQADVAGMALAMHAAGAGVPVVLVSGATDEPSSAVGPFVDRLIEPFTPSYARARLRAALMRRASRWKRADRPRDEAKRLTALHALNILDTPREERFDRITRLAAALFDAPVSLISLVDENRQWFKSTCGIDAQETPRDESFCAHAVVSRAPLIIPDALMDERFAENPLVVNPPRVRFYAGYPLILADGSCIGTLCILDTRPRELDPADLARLADLAALARQEFEPSFSMTIGGAV
jgi:ribonuclease BN (tRNA processing enzyme)